MHEMEPNVSSSAASGEKKFKGVRRRKWGRWVSEIRLPHSRQRIWLGSFDTPEKAARAFDAAYICLRGPAGAAGGLNFPCSPPDFGRTSDPDEVYAVAVSHANRAVVSGTDAAPPCRDAATGPSSEAHGDGPPTAEQPAPLSPAAPTLTPLQVPEESSDDWPSSRLLADLPPLYSPTYDGSHAYTYLLPGVSSLTAAADDIDNVEENESASCPGLWSFDSSEGPSVNDDHVVDVQRNLTYARPSFPDVSSDRDSSTTGSFRVGSI